MVELGGNMHLALCNTRNIIAILFLFVKIIKLSTCHFLTRDSKGSRWKERYDQRVYFKTICLYTYFGMAAVVL